VGAFDITISVVVEATLRYHSDIASILTLFHESGQGTVSVGQFDWGGRLLNSNGGAQWFPQGGRKSPIERKGRRELDCKRDISRRDESRA
jgi:hypothetical protein